MTAQSAVPMHRLLPTNSYVQPRMFVVTVDETDVYFDDTDSTVYLYNPKATMGKWVNVIGGRLKNYYVGMGKHTLTFDQECAILNALHEKGKI